MIGCSTLTYRLVDLPTALDWIAADGFQTIDLTMVTRFCPHVDPLNVDPASLKATLAARGLRVSTCNAWSLTSLAGPDGPDTELEYLRASLRLAAALDCYALTMQPGKNVPGMSWEQQARASVPHLNALGAYANELGVQLTIEAPKSDSLAGTFEQTLRLLELCDPEQVGATLDTSHVHHSGITAVDALANPVYAARVRHVHLRDYKDGSILVTPGDGQVDFATFMQNLAARGYRRDVIFELEYPREQPVEHYRVELRRAAQHIRPLLEQG